MRRTLVLALGTLSTMAMVLTSTSIVAGQVVNGDFENGGTGWTSDQPPNWMITFPPNGGNPGGYARIQSPFGDSQGLGCVRQTFQCNPAPLDDDPTGDAREGSGCAVRLDYQHGAIDSNPLAGRVKIIIDGQLMYTSPPSNNQSWTTVGFFLAEYPCEIHEITLCLEVDAGNNGWIACFDNVNAQCEIGTSVEPSTWGMIKALYP